MSTPYLFQEDEVTQAESYEKKKQFAEQLKTAGTLRAERDDYKRRWHDTRRHLRIANKALETRSLMLAGNYSAIAKLMKQVEALSAENKALMQNGCAGGAVDPVAARAMTPQEIHEARAEAQKAGSPLGLDPSDPLRQQLMKDHWW